MVQLTSEEQKWLVENQPSLKYDAERLSISGLFSINHTYKGITIKDCFEIDVQLKGMSSRMQYPIVYNPDSHIKRIAKIKMVPLMDLHINYSNRLCLGLPERFTEYYPNGFELQLFFEHLAEHMYWVAFYERYGEPPWEAEKHGSDASFIWKVDKSIENNDVDSLRKLYRMKLHTGISKQRLINYLKSPQLIKQLRIKLFNNG